MFLWVKLSEKVVVGYGIFSLCYSSPCFFTSMVLVLASGSCDILHNLHISGCIRAIVALSWCFSNLTIYTTVFTPHTYACMITTHIEEFLALHVLNSVDRARGHVHNLHNFVYYGNSTLVTWSILFLFTVFISSSTTWLQKHNINTSSKFFKVCRKNYLQIRGEIL